MKAPIYAQTSGYLKKWYFDIGSKVKAGEVLAEIDTPEVDQQLQQSLANLKQAQAQLDLSRATYDAMKTFTSDASSPHRTSITRAAI